MDGQREGEEHQGVHLYFEQVITPTEEKKDPTREESTSSALSSTMLNPPI